MIINNTLDGILKMGPKMDAEWKIRISDWLGVAFGRNYPAIFSLQMQMAAAIIKLEEEIRTLKAEAKNLRAQLAQLKRDDEHEQIKRNQKEATDREAAVEQLLHVRRCILMIGDTIAVKLLHVDTTSHFAGCQSPGFLSGKEGFEKEVEAARYFVQKGYMVIMNDLTNCLRIGDLTMKRGDEIRTFEVKSNPKWRPNNKIAEFSVDLAIW